MKKIRILTHIAYILVSLFCILITYQYITNIYELETKLVDEKLQYHFKKLNEDLDEEVLNARATLNVMEVFIMRRLEGRIPFIKSDFEPIMSPLIASRLNQFNLYFALNRELSRKFLHLDGEAYTVHKNKDYVNTPKFNDRSTFILEEFTDPTYQTDETEIWYHFGKKSRDIEITDIYFDKTYMKVWMYSIVKGLYLNNQFVGVLGVDFFLDSFLKEISDAATSMNSSLTLIDNKTRKIFTRTKSGYSIYDLDPKEFGIFIGTTKRNTEIYTKDGKTKLILNSLPLTNFRWTIVSLSDRNTLYANIISRIKVLVIAGLIVLIIMLFIVNYVFKFLNNVYLEMMTQNLSKGIIRMTEGLSHEINNPLATVSLSNDAFKRLLKKKGIEDPAINALIHKTEHATERISHLIKKLADITIPSQEANIRSVPLEEMVNELRNIFSEELTKYKIDLLLSTTHESIKCDPLKMLQVFLVLIENSIEAIKDKKFRWIKIEQESLRHKTILRVIDSGEGIKQGVPNLFLPFYTTKKSELKTGLGLPVARSLMEQQGGSLELEAKTLHTTFKLTLPDH